MYWHAQDEGEIRRGKPWYLAYGELDTTEHGQVGLPTVAVGRLLMRVLEDSRGRD